jgi:EspA/EspE family
VGVLDAIISAWSNARSTFGEGAAQTGARYDSSGPLRAMQSTVQSAAPGSNWTGRAANAYGTANADHSEVLGKLAGLDQRLSAQVDRSAQVVDAGRRNLDAVREWVLNAAAAVPPGKNREQMLLPIVQKGLTQLTEIVTKSNGDLNPIGSQIRGISDEYEALGNQRFAPKKGGGDDVLGVTRDDDKDNPNDQQATDDFKAVVHSTATPSSWAQ